MSYYEWLILAAGCLGVAMGINRAIRTRWRESEALTVLSGVAGFVLIGVSLYTLFASGPGARTSSAVLYMMIFGLSLCAQQLKSTSVIAVFIIVIVGLGLCYAIGSGSFPHTGHERLLKYNSKTLIIGGVIVIAIVVVLAMSAQDKVVRMVLNVLGHWTVVILLSAVSVAHAGLVLFSRGGRGLFKFM
jgi:hypothetical protein